VALAALVALTSPAGAQSRLVADLQAFSTRYHEEPARLAAIRQGLEEALRTDSHVDNHLALAQVCFMAGDVLAATREDKLAAYARGRQAGERAVELSPRNPAAHFWYAVNTARWGQVNGVLRSLVLLPTVWREIDVVLELDPGFTGAYLLAGTVSYEVPELFGGGMAPAEEMFRKGLARDPRFTALRVGLAKVERRRGRLAEARRELEAVLAETRPRNLADWTMKDVPEARALREALGRP
jgi:hypothetical protein